MRTVNLLVIAFLVACASAANSTNTTTLLNTACGTNTAVCAASNAALCCANVVVVTWTGPKLNISTTTASTICVNQTLLSSGHLNATTQAINTTASCIVVNSSFLVKMSAAVASLGFLSLFL
jgi:hypothetical protein